MSEGHRRPPSPGDVVDSLTTGTLTVHHVDKLDGGGGGDKVAVNKVAVNKVAVNKVAVNKVAVNVGKVAVNKPVVGKPAVRCGTA